MLKKFLLAAVVVAMPFMAQAATVDCSQMPPVAMTYVASPQQANSVTTIDGYLFLGYTYLNAANKWYYELYKDPCYKQRPPLTSVSVDTTVSGTVPGGN